MKIRSLTLFTIVALIVASAMPLFASAKEEPLTMVVMELHENEQVVITATTGDDNTDTYYLLTGYKYTGYSQPYSLKTAPFLINTKNKQGLSANNIVATITTSAGTWDTETAKAVFSYTGSTTKTAGKRDRYNVIDFGSYRSGVIAVTMFWISGTNMVEIDMRFNTLYKWSFSGEAGKMDVQNIATHEFGHWAGLDDVYDGSHSWLTMYGYSDFGITYQRTLCAGDVLGLEAVYGN
jgi:hypothetical protein